MDIRELNETDLPALLALCQRAMPREPWTLAILRRRIVGDPGYRQEYHLAAWEADRLAGVMLGSNRSSAAEQLGTLLLFAVAPELQQRGIATELLSELEQRMRTDGITTLRIGHVAPSYFWPGVDPQAMPAICFLERRGFTRVGDAVNMEVDLTARVWDTTSEEVRLAQLGWEIRRLTRDDQAAFDAWLSANWSPGWRYEALDAYNNDPVSVFGALRAGVIHGFAAYNVSAFEHSFGPTGVDETTRGLGLGRVLLLRCLRDLADREHRHCEICWTGPIGFYARAANAKISRVCLVYERK